MLQDYLTLRQAYLTRPDTRTQIHQNYVRNLFLYETFRLGGHNLPPTIFENIVSTGKPQSTETTRQAYDLWQAWQYCEKQAALRQPLDLTFVRAAYRWRNDYFCGTLRYFVRRFPPRRGL